MTFSEIISIVSAAGLIATVVITVLNSNKQNKLTVITSERVNKYRLIERLASEFLGNAACCLLPEDSHRDRERLDAVIKSAYTLKGLFHYGFTHDKKIIDLIDKVESNLSSPDADEKVICSTLKELSSLLDIYLSAEWTRIKTETAKVKSDVQYQKWCDAYAVCEKYHNENRNRPPYDGRGAE